MTGRSHFHSILLMACCGVAAFICNSDQALSQESKATVNAETDVNSIPLVTEIRGRSSAKNSKIEKALLEPASFQFTQTPLFGIAGLISKEHGIPVVLDRSHLEDEGISPDHEVEIDIEKIALGDGLQLMLEPEGMGFIVKNGVLLITSEFVAEATYETRIYDVRAFEMQDPETLADVLTHTTGDGGWISNGGMGDLSFFKGSFIIKQNRETHQQIELVLNQLLQDVLSSTHSPDWPAKNRGNNPHPMSLGGGFGGNAGLQGGGGGGFF